MNQKNVTSIFQEKTTENSIPNKNSKKNVDLNPLL